MSYSAHTTQSFPTRPFVSPARVLNGAGSSGTLGPELQAAGITPGSGSVVIVADAALIGLGLIAPIAAAMRDAGYTVVEGDGIAAEPTPEVIEGLLAVIAGPVSAVVGVGGGSAIDASKLLAVAIANRVPLREGMGPTAELSSVPPIVAVPTTAGTGAEATTVAMLWHEGRKRIFVHSLMVPRVAVLDPDLLAGLPRPVVAASGLDALSHAVESLLSTYRTPLTEAAARIAISRVGDSLEVEFAGTTPGSRQQLSLAAYEAGLALNASVVIGHSLAYTIASRTGLSHGVTCAMALPYCLAHCRMTSEPVLAEMGELVGTSRDATAFLEWVVALTAALGIPSSLAAVGIETDALDAMAAECCTTYPRPNSPRPFSEDEVRELLSDFHTGNIEGAWSAASRVTA